MCPFSRHLSSIPSATSLSFEGNLFFSLETCRHKHVHLNHSGWFRRTSRETGKEETTYSGRRTGIRLLLTEVLVLFSLCDVKSCLLDVEIMVRMTRSMSVHWSRKKSLLLPAQKLGSCCTDITIRLVPGTRDPSYLAIVYPSARSLLSRHTSRSVTAYYNLAPFSSPSCFNRTSPS